MFEDVCLTCGKHIPDPTQAYCSDDCHFLDTSSPSISSASSAVSSPSLGYATGGDVPALVPSVLGAALSKYPSCRRHGYSLSSSSASSTTWSLLTDDDDQDNHDPALAISSYGRSNFRASTDSFYDGSSKSANFADNLKPSALSYARRPSGTNNHSTVPNPHGRTSSLHVPQIPRSAPLHSHFSPDDDAASSDFAFSSRDDSDVEFTSPKPAARSRRNRASLPAYFSLLQISSPADQKRHSSLSSSSANTINRRTPPTPKLPLTNGSHPSLALSSSSTIPSLSTPRGRRRINEEPPRNNTRTGSSSPSPSRSRSRRARRLFVTGDGTSVSDVARGRTTGRRNGSPLPKMIPDGTGLVPETRGRLKVHADVDAPGYGVGRSGLLDRERTNTRSTRVV